MRIAIALFVMIAGCTKQNPQACCTDAVDCMNVGLPDGTTCDDGLLCRGNRCVEVACDVSAQCDLLAPYCSNELCSASCAADAECPGFSQSSAEKFCVSGSCAECREAMNDCPVSAPICAGGACVQCTQHRDCRPGVCVDGTCAPESAVAYVSPNGSTTSECIMSETCNLVRAVQLAPPRQYILLRPGSYQLSASLMIDGKRRVIGTGSERPLITSLASGPILKLAFGADVTLEFIEVRGARNGLTPPSSDAFGVDAPVNATLRVLRATFSQNEAAGISARQSTLVLGDSTFISNGMGVSTLDTKATIDRCMFVANTRTGVYLDGGLYTVNNSFVVRNTAGIEIFANTSSIIEFNTIADNTNTGFYCDALGGTLQFPNNLVARNGSNAEGFGCSFANSIVETNVGPLKFKSPDVAPYDYHLTAGSSAIDVAGSSTLTSDFDGESRPFGDANDIGADELH